MATVKKCYSAKTGELICFKYTALLGRDEHKKQVRISKRVEPFGFTPAKEMKEQKRAADEWEKIERAEYEKQHGKSTEARLKARREKETITFETFIEKIWMSQHVKDGKHTPDTVAFYHYSSENIKSFFRSKYPDIKLSEVDKAIVLDYLSYMRKDAKTKGGTPYSKATIQHHFSTFRNIMEYAVYIDYIKVDPCKKIKPSDRPKREQKEIEFLDEDEAIRFLSCLDSDEEKQLWKNHNRSVLFWKTMVNLMITTGLRRGELVGLQWGDIDRKRMMIDVRRNVTIDTTHKGESDPEKKLHIGETKGKTARKAPLSMYVLSLLDEYKTEQENKYSGAFLPNAYIFCRTDNPYLPIYPTEPTRLMKRYVKRHGLKNVSPHDLRHTAGYLAIEGGASVKEIQALLGHRDPALSLKFYIGISEATQQRTAARIEEMLRPTKEEVKTG